MQLFSIAYRSLLLSFNSWLLHVQHLYSSFSRITITLTTFTRCLSVDKRYTLDRYVDHIDHDQSIILCLTRSRLQLNWLVSAAHGQMCVWPSNLIPSFWYQQIPAIMWMCRMTLPMLCRLVYEDYTPSGEGTRTNIDTTFRDSGQFLSARWTSRTVASCHVPWATASSSKKIIDSPTFTMQHL